MALGTAVEQPLPSSSAPSSMFSPQVTDCGTVFAGNLHMTTEEPVVIIVQLLHTKQHTIVYTMCLFSRQNRECTILSNIQCL